MKYEMILLCYKVSEYVSGHMINTLGVVNKGK